MLVHGFVRWTMLVVVGLAACSTADATAGGDSGEGGTTTTAADPEVEDESDSGNASAADSTDTETTYPGDTSDGPANDEGDDGSGCLLDCGRGGECVLGGPDDAPTCECFDGWAFNGSTCVQCIEAQGGVDLAMSRVRVSVTIDGAVPPASALEYGEISLRHRDTGDVIVLGDTRSPELEASVIEGEYDVYFSRRAGSAVVPANHNARIGSLEAVDGDSVTIDIPLVQLSGAFAFDGAPAPASSAEHGRVWLRDPSSGDEVLLGSTSSGTYAVLVVPGTYEVSYEGLSGAEVAPANRRGSFGSVVVVPGEATLDIDIPTIRLSGAFLFDGFPAPDSGTEFGRVSLRRGDERIDLGETRAGSYDVRVLPGNYDVVYEAVAGAEVAPANTHAVITTFAADGGALVQNVDIATVVLEGALTFNGEPAPADPTDDGYIVLRHANGDEVLLGMTSNGSYTRRVVAGAYDVHYVQDTSREAAPRNTNARIRELVAGVDPGDIDVARVDVSGPILLDGATPPDSDYQDGHVYLRDMITGDSVLLGNTRDGQFAAPVVPGEYEVVYVAETAGAPLPVNTGAVIDDVVIEAGQPFELPIDVPARSLAGAVTINGQAGPTDGVDVGSLFLVDAQTRDQIYLGNTRSGVYAQTITPGSYLLQYRVEASSGAVPANVDANLGCWTLK